MKILEVTCWLSEGKMRGGGAIVCRDSAMALQELGHDVRILCGDYAQAQPRLTVWDDDSQEVPITRIAMEQSDRLRYLHRKRNPEAAKLFGEFLDRWKPDLIHFHSMQGIGFHCLVEAQRRGIATAITPHDYWWVSPFQFLANMRTGHLLWTPAALPFFRAFLRREFVPSLRADLTPFGDGEARGAVSLSQGSKFDMLREMLHTFGPIRRMAARADVIIASSHFLEDIYQRAGMKNVVFQRYICSPEPAKMTKRDPGEGPLRFGLMGGADVWKGAKRGIRAIREFAEGEAELLIWGTEEPPNDPDALDPRVRWCGRLPMERRHEVHAEMDVFLQLSYRHENCPMAILESQAARTPVIATDAGGNFELVRDGADGLVVPREDFDALVGAMRRLVDDREQVRNFIANASRRKLGLDRAKELAALFEKVIAEKKR